MCFNMQERNVPTSMTTSTKQPDKEEAKRKLLLNMQITKVMNVVTFMINLVGH